MILFATQQGKGKKKDRLEKRIDALENHLNGHIETTVKVVIEGFKRNDKRFDSIEARLDGIGATLEDVKTLMLKQLAKQE